MAYMMQSVEYDSKDFLSWVCFDVKEGGLPNKVGFTFKKTSKAKLVMFIAMTAVISTALLGICFLLIIDTWVRVIIALTLFLASPFIAALAVAVAVWTIGKRQIQSNTSGYLKNIEEKIGNSGAQKIAIAGSYGKSTMKEILATVIGESKIVGVVPENHNTPVGISNFADTLTGDEEVLIIELGEYYPGDVERLAAVVKPDFGVITGINEMHLVKMGSKENTINTVYELADFVEQQNLLVNTESDWAQEAISEGNIGYSQNGVGDWSVSKSKTDLNGVEFDLSKQEAKLKVRSILLGKHQVGPLSAAAYLAMKVGLSVSEAEAGIDATTSFPRRFELALLPGGVYYVDDSYNGNRDGFLAAIDFLDQLNIDGKIIYITPGLVEQGDQAEAVHKQVGRRLASSNIDRIVLVDNKLSQIIADEIELNNPERRIDIIPDQQDFLTNVTSFSSPGDVVFVQNSQAEDFFYH